MARSLFSSSWHSVADLKPRLVPQARIYRHVYRGQVWFVVQDQSGGKYHRLTPAAHSIASQMDGKTTVQTLWEQANTAQASDACTQNEVVDLLVHLHEASLLQADGALDSVALLESYHKKRRATFKQWLMNPMSLKVPLINPDGFLTRWVSWGGFFFNRLGAIIWLLVVLPAVVLAAQHWNELTNNLSDRVLSSSNLWVMALIFPLVKLIHELGHGFAVKRWGGAVHEMGLMFLVFMPLPYVNASSSAAFPSKIRRAIVAAAGMMSELFVAALAMYVWLLVEPGLVRAVAFNVMVVAGVSTLIVNGNPLLRYDGYYILTDLIEMPNLAQRGQKYLTYLWDRYAFGAQDAECPVESASEKRWLAFYTPLAWCYRMFVTISIILFIADKFFIFSVLIAVWGTITLIGIPVWKAYRHVVSSPVLQRRREQSVRISLTLIGIVLAILFVLPVPLHTNTEGVVWLPDRAILHAGGAGFFQRWLVPPGSEVAPGTPLFALQDKLLAAEIESSHAKVAEAEATFRSEEFSDPVKAAISGRKLVQEKQVLARLEERAAKLVGFAETTGRIEAAAPQDMPGQYFKKGDLIGYVLDNSQLKVRAVITQDDIDLLSSRVRAVELRFADALSRVEPATLARQIPAAVNELPSAALGLAGGGTIPTLPGDQKGLKTVDRVFLVDLILPKGAQGKVFGERVYVRFDLGYEALAFQWLRRFRQLFLSRFGV